MDDRTPYAPRNPAVSDRRSGAERRHRHWYGLLLGHEKRRRQNPRRVDEHNLAVVDWHHPQWLLVSVLIVVLSVVDAFATLTLLSHGAQEINPVMAPLVTGSGHSFAFWKMGLTVFGVVILTSISRIRFFRGLQVGVLLYLVLAAYIVLVAYEAWLLWGDHGLM